MALFTRYPRQKGLIFTLTPTLQVDEIHPTLQMLTMSYQEQGFLICYAGCPVIWSSKLQTEIALSTSKAEYIAMYQALREALPVQRLANEINCIVPLYTPTTKFCLTVHKDNLSSIAMCFLCGIDFSNSDIAMEDRLSLWTVRQNFFCWSIERKNAVDLLYQLLDW